LQTIPADEGLFLAETWRLHPDICAFTSELFYEGKLKSTKSNIEFLMQINKTMLQTGRSSDDD